MKSFRGTIIFTLIVIGAGVFSYFQVFKKGNEEIEKKELSSQIYKLKIDEITRIELSNGENSSLLQKTGETWALEKPYVDKADQTQVKNFLDTVLREKTSEIVEEGEKLNLKTYGLDRPSFRLKLSGVVKDAKGPNISEDVSFGSVKAYDGSVYSRFGEEKKVYLAPSYLNSALNKKADDFRNKNLYTAAIADVEKIEILGKERLVLQREKQNWKMLEPKNYMAPVSADSIQSLLDLLRNLKGVEIVAENKADSSQIKKFHLDKPGLSLRLHRAQEPQNYELKISDPKNDKNHNIYLMGSDANTILRGVQSNLDTMNKSAFDFADKHQAFTFGSLEAEYIRISNSAFKADLKKVGNAWQNVDPADKRELNSSKVDELLSKFSHLEAKALLKLKPEKLRNEISILDSSKKPIFQMNWGEAFEEIPVAKKAQAQRTSSGKLVHATTNKIKEVVSMAHSQIESLGLKALFTNPDPIQFSGSPPGEKSEASKLDRPAAAALDQHSPAAANKEK